MEEFLENPGLCHIVNNISRYLDPKSLARCRVVSYSWKNLIDNGRLWLIFQLEHIHNQEKIFTYYSLEGKPKVITTIKARFPEWNTFVEEVSKRLTIPILKEFVKFMWIYFKDESTSLTMDPLHDAVTESNTTFVQLLIKSGINLEMRNTNGWTPLHTGCTNGNIEMVQLLIKHLPNFEASSGTNDGKTIFHHAVENSDLQVLKLILETFRFEDVSNKDGWKMLHDAVAFGPKATIQYLMESRRELGMNIEDRLYDGRTILHLACSFRDIEIVDLVYNALEEINSDINFDTRNEDQATPLHFACKNKTSGVAIHLLQRFPDKIHVLGIHGIHLLHFACRYGHLELVKYIFGNPDFDIDFNIATLGGNTSLHFACYVGHYEVVKFMLENSSAMGIDVTKRTIDQKTAEDYARQKGHKKIVGLFIKSKLQRKFW